MHAYIQYYNISQLIHKNKGKSYAKQRNEYGYVAKPIQNVHFNFRNCASKHYNLQFVSIYGHSLTQSTI